MSEKAHMEISPGEVWQDGNGRHWYVVCKEGNGVACRLIIDDKLTMARRSYSAYGVVLGDTYYMTTKDDLSHRVKLSWSPKDEPKASITGKPIENPADPAWLTFLDTVDRKTVPLATGLFDYFPDALAAVAHCSHVANEQHNPGEAVHWNRDKSTDHDNTLLRHFSQRGTVDADGVRHRAKVAWRALAALQIEIEKDLNK